MPPGGREAIEFDEGEEIAGVARAIDAAGAQIVPQQKLRWHAASAPIDQHEATEFVARGITCPAEGTSRAGRPARVGCHTARNRS